MFRAKWPFLARAEALLLFAASLGAGRQVVAMIPAAAELVTLESVQLGIPAAVTSWGLAAFMLTGPFLGAMVLVDRMLAARRGYAVLSVLAVAAWAGFAALFSRDILAAVPAGWRPEAGLVPLIAAIAILVHARPFWIGLTDRGCIGPGSQARTQAGPNGRNALAAVILAATLVGLVAAVMHLFSAPPPVTEPFAMIPERPVALGPRPALPLPRLATPGGEASALRQRDGSFVFEVHIDERSVPMVFDTGASRVTLRAEDAARLGIPVDDLVYSARLRTANGTAAMAQVTLGQMSIGSITVDNVPAVVARQGTLQSSLLGQSFLERLKSYDVQSNRVTLHGH